MDSTQMKVFILSFKDLFISLSIQLLFTYIYMYFSLHLFQICYFCRLYSGTGGCNRVCYLDHEEASYSGCRVMRSTGDLVEVTSRGLIFIGRTDDQIKRHGKRMSLSSVQRVSDVFVFLTHPAMSIINPIDPVVI